MEKIGELNDGGAEIYDDVPEGPVIEKLDQISGKLDGLNKCSISTIQMAKKVYAGLSEVKQVSGNLRAEIGKFHTTSAELTKDLKEVNRDINWMQEKVEETCSTLETRLDQILHNIATEQQQQLNSTAEQFLSSLVEATPENPIQNVATAVTGVRSLAWAGVVIGVINLMLMILLIISISAQV